MFFICFDTDVEPWRRREKRKERVVAERSVRIKRKEEKVARLIAEIETLKEKP